MSDACISELKLPSTWEWVPVAELAADEPRAITDGPFGSNLKSAHYTESGPRVIRLQNVGDGKFHDAEAHISEEHFASLRDHEAKPGDIVMASLGGELPRACLVPEWLGPAIVKADCPRMRPHPSVNREYLVATLNSSVVRRQAAEVIHGMGRPRLKLAELKKLLLPLPPRAEQDRIVGEINRIQEISDEADRRFERATRLLKEQRASILASAVTGSLTSAVDEALDARHLIDRVLEARHAAWRGDREAGRRAPARFPEPAEPRPIDGIELPVGWAWATVDQLAIAVQYGTSAKTTDSADVPVLRMGNIQDGEIDSTDLKYLPSTHDEFPALLLRPGDLLFNRTNSPELVGKSAVYLGSPRPCSYASYLIRVRVADGIDPRYVAFFLNSPFGREWVAQNVSQQVGQANVNGSKLKALTLPLPPEATQRAICAEVDRQHRANRMLERVLSEARERNDLMRRSVLARACSGQLVPQHPADTPARQLVEVLRFGRERRASRAKRPRPIPVGS